MLVHLFTLGMWPMWNILEEHVEQSDILELVQEAEVLAMWA